MLKSHLKISQIVFINFIFLLAAALFVVSIASYYLIKDIEVRQYANQMKSEIAYVNLALQEGKSLQLATKEMSEIMGRPLRVTLIAKDGTPLYDNEANVSTMENHATRPEVMQAYKQGFGMAVRYSKTVKNDRIYVAKPILWNNKNDILRLSVSLKSVMSDFTVLWLRLSGIFLVILFVGFLISRTMQKEIQSELGKLTQYLQAIADKKYKSTFTPGFADEFSSIAQLLRRLAKRLEKGERKKRKYTAKIRMISKQRSDIISAISHEFKNPVAAIMGYTETLLDSDVSPAIRKKFLERIDQNSKRITEMIDRLSFITRLENSDITAQRREFDILPVINDASSSLMQKYKGRIVRVNAESCTVYADKTMMEMVIVNLIDNALKYSEDEVNVTLEGINLCVHDIGEGIAEKEIEEVTKKFYRIDKNAWDNSMGLGLSIVKYILNLHHSSITITSNPHDGTFMCFIVPSICNISPDNNKKK